MAFRNNAIATLWNNNDWGTVIKFSDKYADIQMSTQKKNRLTNEYETDFSSKVRCLGKAFETLKTLELREKFRIKLLDVEVTNKYDKEKKVMYVNYLVWDLEPYVMPEQQANGDKTKSELIETSVGNDDDFPF